MSVIAWDGKTLAADRQATAGSFILKARKIFRHGDLLCGWSGQSDLCALLKNWFVNGQQPELFPVIDVPQDGITPPPELLVVHPDGWMDLYTTRAVPLRIVPQIYAIGSAWQIALTAMHLGYNSKRAVEVAIDLDCYCGGGVDELWFVKDGES